jgi:hypothetical protein
MSLMILGAGGYNIEETSIGDRCRRINSILLAGHISVAHKLKVLH